MTAIVTINTLPTTTNVDVQGAQDINHITDHSPDITWSYSDTDGQTQGQYNVEVRTASDGNGILMGSASNSGSATTWTYSGASLLDGQTYYSRVRTNDGLEWGVWDEIQFRMNSNPSITSIDVIPDNPKTNDVLTCSVLTSDNEGDSVSLSYVWKDSGIVIPDQASSTLNCGSVGGCDKNDVITCEAIPHDGYEYGAMQSSSETIENTPPTNPTDLVLNTVLVGETLTATCTGGDDADGESLIKYYEFYNVNDSTTVQAWSISNLYNIQVSDAHDQIRVKCKNYDDEEYSGEIMNSTTVQGTAPTLGSITAIPDPVKGGSDITISADSYNDADNDSLSLYCVELGIPSTGNYDCYDNDDFDGLNCSYTTAADDTNHTIKCKVYDTQEYSNEENTIYETDSTPPTITFDSVAGDQEVPYWDIVDNQETYINVDVSESDSSCKWSYTDINYDSMTSTCITAGMDIQCDLGNVAETSSETAYIGCKDSVGNIQPNNLVITFGVDFTEPSTFITNITGGTITGNHLPGYQIVLNEEDVPAENVPDKVFTWNCTHEQGSSCSIIETPASGNIDNGTIVTFNTRGTNTIKYYSKDEAGHTQTPIKSEEIIINSLPVITNGDLGYYLGGVTTSWTGKYGKRVMFICDASDENAGGPVSGLNGDYSAKIWLRHFNSGSWIVSGVAMNWDEFNGRWEYDHLLDDLGDKYGKAYDMMCEVTDDMGESANFTRNSIFTVRNTPPYADEIFTNDTSPTKFTWIRWYCGGADIDSPVHIEANLTATFSLAIRGEPWMFENESMGWDSVVGEHYYDYQIVHDGGTRYDAKCYLNDGVDTSDVYAAMNVNNTDGTIFTTLDDWDGDGISDSVDNIEGFGTNLDTDLDVIILVDNIEENNSVNTHLVEFKDNSDNQVFISFNNNFTVYELLTPNIKVKRSKTDRGSVLVKGLSGVSKTLRIPKVIASGLICVKEAEITSVDEITTNCTEANETLFTNCNTGGEIIGSLTCTDKGNFYEVTGLMHSAGIEYGNARLEIWTEGTYLQLDTINFLANYTNATSIEPISGANCSIWFEDTGWNNMTFNGSQHLYNRIFIGSGDKTYNVSCTHSIYTDLAIEDSFSISSSAIPEFSTITLGLGLIAVLAGLFIIRRKK